MVQCVSTPKAGDKEKDVTFFAFTPMLYHRDRGSLSLIFTRRRSPHSPSHRNLHVCRLLYSVNSQQDLICAKAI